MRKLRWGLAVLLGTLLAGAVQLWPPRPVWAVPAGDNDTVLGFGDGGRSVVALRWVADGHDQGVADGYRLQRLALDTGVVLVDAAIAPPPGSRGRLFGGLSPGGTRVVVSGRKHELVGDDLYAPCRFAVTERFVIDARTGATLSWPLESTMCVSLSPCGR